jgi:hypothetical protein
MSILLGSAILLYVLHIPFELLTAGGWQVTGLIKCVNKIKSFAVPNTVVVIELVTGNFSPLWSVE